MKQKDLIEKYGYIDTNDRSSLYCTVNSKPNNQGLYVKIEQEAVRLYHVNGSVVAEWAGENLINSFVEKMPTPVIVYADTRINSEEREEFWFNEAFYLTQLNEDNLLDLIKQDIVVVDVRMHLKENGSVRNHGTAFRIDERFWNLCFGNRKKLI